MRRLTNLVVPLVLVVTGCGTARYLKKTPTGGTLELEGDPDKANKDAKRLMAEHCRSGYDVVAQGERLIGTEAERLQATKMEFVCKAQVVKVKAPPAPVPDAPVPAAGVPDAGPPQ
jgi:hypothetical protein